MGQHSKPRHHARHAKPSRAAQAVAGAGGAAAAGTLAVAAVTTPAASAAPLPSDVAAAPPVAVVHLAAAHRAAAATITVQPGDTLSGLAARDCGSAAKWPGLYAANAATVKDPDLIFAGQVLRVACTSAGYVPRHTAAVAVTVQAAAVAPSPQAESSGDAYSAFPGAACIVTRESGGNPAAQNPYSTASGLFQDLDSTWNGYGGYLHAKDAPVSVQIAFNRQLSGNGADLTPWAADGCPGT